MSYINDAFVTYSGYHSLRRLADGIRSLQVVFHRHAMS